jgi:hypothetical protein
MANAAAARGSPHDRQASIQFLSGNNRRYRAVAAKLSGAGQRCGEDDERATGEAKHAARKAKWIPAQNPGIPFPAARSCLQNCSGGDNCVVRHNAAHVTAMFARMVL